MKLKNSKKADGFKMLNYGFWRILFISMVFVFVYLLVASVLHTKIDVYDLRASLYANRLLSNSQYTYSSEYTGRVYPYVINSNYLADFENNQSRFAASLVVEPKGKVGQEVFVNKKWFDRYYPLAKFDKYHGYLYWSIINVKNESIEPGRALVKTIENE